MFSNLSVIQLLHVKLFGVYHLYYWLLFLRFFNCSVIFEISICLQRDSDDITIEEINSRPLSMNLTQSSQEVSWTFRIFVKVQIG